MAAASPVEGTAKTGMNPLKAVGGGDIMDTDTKSAMAEVMAVYGARGDAASDKEDAELAKEVEEAPIVRLANTILQQAIKEKASDIHLEPDRRGIRVRYRIDGVLHEIMQMPTYIKMPLVARFKILSEMNIAERRVPAGRPYRHQILGQRVRPARFLPAQPARRKDRHAHSGQGQRHDRSEQARLHPRNAG